jgi:hypothetical protein
VKDPAGDETREGVFLCPDEQIETKGWRHLLNSQFKNEKITYITSLSLSLTPSLVCSLSFSHLHGIQHICTFASPVLVFSVQITAAIGGRGTANFVINLGRKEANLSFVQVKNKTRRTYTAEDSGKYVPIVAFECRGVEPGKNWMDIIFGLIGFVDIVFARIFTFESVEDLVFASRIFFPSPIAKLLLLGDQ